MFDVFYVDDERSSIRLVREACAESEVDVRLHAVRSGETALEVLCCDCEYPADSRPDLVLLDLDLVELSGLDVLERVRDRPALCSIPFVMFTNSEAAAHIEAAYESGANAYVQKPDDFEDLVTFVTRAVDFWQSDSTNPPPAQ